jgi:hypothetical protein
MSDSIFVPSAIPANRSVDRIATAPAAIETEKFKLIRPDYSVLLPLAGMILLVIGFGVVAAPLLVHDIPMLLN